MGAIVPEIPRKLTWQIRGVARDLARALARPVSIREIVTVINKNYPEIAAAVSRKSIDYVRVTISTTAPGHFVKYRAGRGAGLSPSELSSQKLYWGVYGDKYPPAWLPVADGSEDAAVLADPRPFFPPLVPQAPVAVGLPPPQDFALALGDCSTGAPWGQSSPPAPGGFEEGQVGWDWW